MKSINILLTAAILLTLASCQRDTDDPNPTNTNPYRKMLVEQTYQGGSKQYFLYIVNPGNRTIRCVRDSARNYYEDYFYDASGKLQKVVANNWDETVPSSRDSLVIGRPSANVIQLDFTDAVLDIGYTATTSDLGGGRKQILMTYSGLDPVKNNVKFIFNTSGAPDSIMYRAEDFNPGDIHLFKREIFYNSSGVPTNATYTDVRGSSPAAVTTYNITKDTKDNAYLHSMLDSLYGTDLGWLAYDSHIGLTRFFDQIFTDKLMLLKGSTTSMNVIFPSETRLYEYIVTYDSKGRILTWNEKSNGVATYDVDITYFD